MSGSVVDEPLDAHADLLETEVLVWAKGRRGCSLLLLAAVERQAQHQGRGQRQHGQHRRDLACAPYDTVVQAV
jgi:hypothetical protein